MAEVFLAETDDGERVALKRLLGDDVDHLDRFLDEARIVARFAHPNIVGVRELGCDEDGLYLALEYIDGRSLSAILARARIAGPPLSRHVAAHVVAEVARALDYVHRAVGDDGAPLGVVHRDVSPSNVLVSIAGDVKLTDFGISKARDAAHRTRTGTIAGTAGYMSPEQVAGDSIDARSDVWSAGVLLWESTLGRRLFHGAEAPQRIRAGAVPAPSSIDSSYPPELENAVMAALVCDPDRRCDAGALVAALECYLARLGSPPCRAELSAAMSTWFTDASAVEPARVVEAETQPLTPSDRRPFALAGIRPVVPPDTVPVVRASNPRRARIGLWSLGAGALSAALATGLVAANSDRATREPSGETMREDGAAGHGKLAAAWRIAQRGGHEQARQIVDELLDAKPNDAEVMTLAVLVHWWLGTPRIEALYERAQLTRLAPERRALLSAIRLLHLGRTHEAVNAMEEAEKRHPGTAEIAYALGEARWHAGDRAGGVAALTTAVRRDPRWQMALHHVIDEHVARGDIAALRSLAATLAPSDAAASQSVAVTALIAERRYGDAVDAARAATIAFAEDALLWQRRAAAEVLAGELDAASQSLQRAVALWPIDERERGPFAQLAELALYAGDEQRFEAMVGAQFSPTNMLRLAIWYDGAGLSPKVPDRVAAGPGRRMPDSAMAPPPLFECVSLLGPELHGADTRTYWSRSTQPEVRHFGAGFAALRAKDFVRAETELASAHELATAETQPLFAYYLARARHERGDAAGAAAACADVIRPRGYVPYRAVLLRDCTRWAKEKP